MALKMNINFKALPPYARVIIAVVPAILIVAVVLFVLILATTSNFLLFLLGNRNMASFLPLRDCSLYVHDIKRVYPADE